MSRTVNKHEQIRRSELHTSRPFRFIGCLVCYALTVRQNERALKGAAGGFGYLFQLVYSKTLPFELLAESLWAFTCFAPQLRNADVELYA